MPPPVKHGITAALLAAAIYIAIATVYKQGFTNQTFIEGLMLGAFTFVVVVVIGFLVSRKNRK